VQHASLNANPVEVEQSRLARRRAISITEYAIFLLGVGRPVPKFFSDASDGLLRAQKPGDIAIGGLNGSDPLL